MGKWLYSEQTSRFVNADAARAIIPIQVKTEERDDGWAWGAWYGRDEDGRDLVIQISQGVSTEHFKAAELAIAKSIGSNKIPDLSHMDKEQEELLVTPPAKILVP